MPNVVWFLLIFIMLSCSFFSTGVEETTHPHVEVVVPMSENIKFWSLSPDGDKILYTARPKPDESEIRYLLFLKDRQKEMIDGCDIGTNWLDNTHFICFTVNKNNEITYIITDDFTRIPLEKVNASNKDIEELLQNAGTIYKYKGDTEAEKGWIVILGTDYKDNPAKNFEVNVDNVDEILAGYDVVVIPPSRYARYKNIYSPNGKYYFVLGNGVLTIYDATTREKLVSFEIGVEAGYINEDGGWAADSSGVYFQVTYGSGFGSTTYGAIRKLNAW